MGDSPEHAAPLSRRAPPSAAFPPPAPRPPLIGYAAPGPAPSPLCTNHGAPRPPFAPPPLALAGCHGGSGRPRSLSRCPSSPGQLVVAAAAAGRGPRGVGGTPLLACRWPGLLVLRHIHLHGSAAGAPGPSPRRRRREGREGRIAGPPLGRACGRSPGCALSAGHWPPGLLSEGGRRQPRPVVVASGRSGLCRAREGVLVRGGRSQLGWVGLYSSVWPRWASYPTAC